MIYMSIVLYGPSLALNAGKFLVLSQKASSLNTVNTVQTDHFTTQSAKQITPKKLKASNLIPSSVTSFIGKICKIENFA